MFSYTFYLTHCFSILSMQASNIQMAGVSDAFRLVVNNGKGAGQTVFHLHLHVLAKKGSQDTFSEDNL